MNRWLIYTLRGGIAGAIAALFYDVLLASQGLMPMMTSFLSIPAIVVLFGALYGALFGALFRDQLGTPGEALFWGVHHGLIGWLIGPLTITTFESGVALWSIEAARATFPQFLGFAVFYGALMGLLYHVLRILIPFQPDQLRISVLQLGRAMVSGGLAGLIGGWVFGAWMTQADYFPLIAGLFNSDALGMGRGLHLFISVVIGVVYGVLFMNDDRGVGSGTVRGVVYGFIWWVIGMLTLLPWLNGDGVQWRVEAAREAYAPLIGHILYGLMVSLIYTALNNLWRVLFVTSDPLYDEAEGPGARNLRALGYGVVASVFGGLLFTVTMLQTETLPVVAGLLGMSSSTAGFIIHMVISAIIGATFGVFFRTEGNSYGENLAWGMSYGLLWWFLGPLTLMPVLLGQPLQWSLEASVANLPSLIGHLIYGGVIALVFHWLALRYGPNTEMILPESRPRASALWMVALLLGITMPLLLI